MLMRCWRSSGKCVCCFVTLRQITTSKSTGARAFTGPGDKEQGAGSAGRWLDHMSVAGSGRNVGVMIYQSRDFFRRLLPHM